MRRSAELALAQENIQNEKSRLEFCLRCVSPSLKVEKWKFGLVLKKANKELSFRRLSEIEKAEQRSRHSSCVCLCLYGLSCYFTTLITHHWHQVTVSAKCYQSGIVHVCTFACATRATFKNYNHLYSSQHWALVLDRTHLPPVLFQVCFFVYTFVYLKHLDLYSFFFSIAVERALPFLSLCSTAVCTSHASILLSSPSCLSLKWNFKQSV